MLVHDPNLRRVSGQDLLQHNILLPVNLQLDNRVAFQLLSTTQTLLRQVSFRHDIELCRRPKDERLPPNPTAKTGQKLLDATEVEKKGMCRPVFSLLCVSRTLGVLTRSLAVTHIARA